MLFSLDSRLIVRFRAPKALAWSFYILSGGSGLGKNPIAGLDVEMFD